MCHATISRGVQILAASADRGNDDEPVVSSFDDDDDKGDAVTSKPAPRLFRTAREAEEHACAWMRYLGWETATLTGHGADGGVDVRAAEAVAQVKAEAVKTSSERLQALFGIAAHEQRTAVFFSLGGYTLQALKWAASTGMTLFEFDQAGDIRPASRAAVDLLVGRKTTIESTRAALPQVLDRTEAAARDLGFLDEARRIAAHHLAANIWFHLFGVLGPDQFSRLPDHPAAALIFDLSLLAEAPDMAERLLSMQQMPIDPLQTAIDRDMKEPFPVEFKPLFRATLELSDALDFLWPTRDPDPNESAVPVDGARRQPCSSRVEYSARIAQP